jgi:hypothetical protein
MSTVLECTTEEQRYVVSLSWAKGLNAKDIHKEMFLVYGVKCLSRKAVPHGWQNFADGEEVETEMRKWLRQQSKDFYAVGFYALVKRWDKCINVGGGYVEKFVFFQALISYVLRFISICDLFTDFFYIRSLRR